MSDPNTPSPGPTPDQAGSTNSTGPNGNWRDMRRAERVVRRVACLGLGGYRGYPVGALVLIAIGVIFLLGNFGLHIPAQWWAIFLLVPAAGLLVTAIRFYRVDNTYSGRAMGPLIGGSVLLAMALAIFFGLTLCVFWPIVLIAVGAATIARRGQPRRW